MKENESFERTDITKAQNVYYIDRLKIVNADISDFAKRI